MNVLRITLLGQVAVTRADLSSKLKVTRVGQGLLAYLLLYRHRSHPRDVLATLFWGDHGQQRARGCLNTALWRLRQVLEPEGIPRGTYLQTRATGEIQFNPASDYWLDVAAFEENSNHVLAKPVDAMESTDADNLESALQLYTGELLEGFYDDWVLREQERLRSLYLNCLAQLVQYYEHHEAYQKGLICGQKILDEDPLREEIHREMMRLYLASGQRAMALRQYEACSKTMASELGIRPMAETQALHREILAKEEPGRVPVAQNQAQIGHSQLLQQLRLVIQDFEQAQSRLLRAIHIVQQHIDD